MGWWWSSSVKDSQSVSSIAPPATSDNQSHPPSSDQFKQPFPTRSLSREEQAEQDLQNLLSSFQDESQATSRPIQSPLRFLLGSNSGSKPTTSQSSNAKETPGHNARNDVDLESVNLPTTLSCRDCFDYAFFCQSFGGQFANVYRYGELRNCKEHWSDFWFCMRTKSYVEEEKTKMIQDRWRRKEMKFKTGPSSEDVWDARTKRVEGAFTGNWDDIFKAEKELEENMERDLTMAARAGQGKGNLLDVEKLERVVDGARS